MFPPRKRNGEVAVQPRHGFVFDLDQFRGLGRPSYSILDLKWCVCTLRRG